jgi:hypothetical protein
MIGRFRKLDKYSFVDGLRNKFKLQYIFLVADCTQNRIVKTMGTERNEYGKQCTECLFKQSDPNPVPAWNRIKLDLWIRTGPGRQK